MDTALRENAARKDLLLALGFDNETQHRFIESAVKRQAVYTILQGEHNRTNPSPTPGERLAEIPLTPSTRFDGQAARRGAESADLRSDSGQAIDSLNTNTELTDVVRHREANALDPTVTIDTYQSRETFANMYSDRELVILSRDTRQIITTFIEPVQRCFVAYGTFQQLWRRYGRDFQCCRATRLYAAARSYADVFRGQY